MAKKTLKQETGSESSPKRTREAPSSSTPPSPPPGTTDEPDGDSGASLGLWVRAAPEVVIRGLIIGSIVALVAAAAAGALRTWIWVLALEPLAIGVVIGESAAAPTSARHRRPPTWSYAYVFGIGFCAYLIIHLTFWILSAGFPPSISLFAFLRAAPSATATPLFQSVDLARQLALASGGAPVLKYFIWLAEAVLSGAAASLAYRAGSVRTLRN